MTPNFFNINVYFTAAPCPPTMLCDPFITCLNAPTYLGALGFQVTGPCMP